VSAVLAEELGRVPIVTLSEVADLVRGVSYPKTDVREEPAPDFVPVLRATNIQDARLILDSDMVFVAERNVSPEQLLRPGDIVVATSSGSKHLVGKSGQLHATWHGSFGAFCAAVRPRPGIHPRYLALFLQAPAYWHQISKKALGVNINNLRRGDLESLELPLPPPSIQERIVAELEKQFSRLDKAVGNLKRVKDRLDGYKGSIISEAVGGRATADDRVVPKGWRQGLLGDVVAKITSGSRDWSPYYGRGAAIFLLAQNVRSMAPDFSVVQHVDPPEADPARARSRVQRGDLLVTIVGANTGQACMVQELPGESFVCQSVALIRPMIAANAAYLNLWFNSPDHGRRYFDRCMYGQGRPHLGFDQLAAMPITIPPPYEQVRIIAEVDRRLSIVREVDVEVDTNLRRAQGLRQAVLARAFNEGSVHA